MKVLIIGPFPNPVSGVSLANKIIYDFLPIYYKDVKLVKVNTSYSVLKENIGKFSIGKTIYYLRQYKSLTKVFNCDKLYYTTGQTFFGVIKYIPFLILAKLLNKEIIVHVHGNYLHEEYRQLKGLKKLLFKKTIGLCSKGIVLSDSLRKNLTPFMNERSIFALENFVEDFLFEKQGVKDFNKLKIVFLSNLMTEKGIFDVLRALELIAEEGVAFESKIAGGIDPQIQCDIYEYFTKLNENTEYLGVIHGSNKKKLLEWGNVFLFPTYYSMEGQPIAILEAMATGSIIMTTKHAGIPDVFKESVNGIYVEKRNPKDIALKLKILSESLTEYSDVSFQNKIEAEEKYRVKNFIDKLYNVLDRNGSRIK